VSRLEQRLEETSRHSIHYTLTSHQSRFETDKQSLQHVTHVPMESNVSLGSDKASKRCITRARYKLKLGLELTVPQHKVE
jgi:hypothetical protein